MGLSSAWVAWALGSVRGIWDYIVKNGVSKNLVFCNLARPLGFGVARALEPTSFHQKKAYRCSGVRFFDGRMLLCSAWLMLNPLSRGINHEFLLCKDGDGSRATRDFCTPLFWFPLCPAVAKLGSLSLCCRLAPARADTDQIRRKLYCQV